MPSTGKILILNLNNRLLSLLIQNNQILSAQVQKQDDYAVGSIYIGKVQNISANIGAAFVDLGGGYLTFLPLSEARDAHVLNRRAEGNLKPGDELLVQINKEPMKTKLAGATTRISLSGSYAVVSLPRKENAAQVLHENSTEQVNSKTDTAEKLTKTVNNINISSKLNKKKEIWFKNDASLQDIAARTPLIIRTNAGELETTEPVIEEAEQLSAELLRIAEVADKRTCFSCLYRSRPDYINFVKNSYRTEYDEVITDLPEVYETLKTELSDIAENAIPIRLYQDERLPLYKLYSVETRIKELLDKKVWLKSGGYLVIEPTEALISIDVNTGKCEKGNNKEETFLKINLEAAEMIALQLRARNLSGMILVDFINMKKKEYEEQVIGYMRSLLKKDTVRAGVVDMTGLGLLELTRQKVKPSFAEQMRGQEQ
jgi:ribonuclease G